MPTIDTQPPTVPAGLTATRGLSGQINLAWSAASDAVGVTAYKVYRGGSLIATLGNVTSYTDSGLTCGTTYSYAVSACDAAGNCSASSTPVAVTTSASGCSHPAGAGPVGSLPALDTQAPSVPTGLTATPSGTSRIDLYWTYSTDDFGVTAYKVYRGGSLVATLGNVTNYSDTGLAASTSYSYAVSACDAAENCSAQSASASAKTQALPDTQAPTDPTGLIITWNSSAGAFDVSWTPSVDNVGVTTYRIYRDGSLIATLGKVTSYRDANVPLYDGIYFYGVQACDAAGNCSTPPTFQPDTQTPTYPTALTATPGGTSRIDLSWTSSLDNIGVTAYKVYRDGTLIATLGNVTSYSDTGLTASSSYSYAVSACDAAGNCSVQSTAALANTQAPPIPAIRSAPAVFGTPAGPITSQTLTVTVTPPANVLSLTASLFVAAVLPPSLGSAIFVMSPNGGWTAYASCSFAPAAQVKPLASGLQISVLATPMNLASLRGTAIYVGYGFGATAAAACADMLNSSTITRAYTVN